MESLKHENEVDSIGFAMDCLADSPDFLNFLGDDDDDDKLFTSLGLDATNFETDLPDLSQDADMMEDVNFSQPFELPCIEGLDGQMETMEAPVDYAPKCNPQMEDSTSEVVMGIPYYVACQWKQAQEAQVQQQQAAAMLWWQAYLCGAFGVPGVGNGLGSVGFSAQQLGWAMQPHLQAQPGFNPEGVFPHLAAAAAAGVTAPIVTAGKAGGGGGGGVSAPKRRRRNEGSGPAGPSGESGQLLSSKKGRRPKQEERVCKNCGTRTTPFWRKNKQDGLPLCNACGLYLAKNDAPRPKVLWKSGSDENLMETSTIPAAPSTVTTSVPQEVVGMSTGGGLKETPIAPAPSLAVGPSTPLDVGQAAH